jgi:endonuclease I
MKYILVFILFLGTVTAMAQIPPGYYDAAAGLTGEDLRAALHDIIDDHIEYSYDDLRDFILMDTDEDPDNPNNIILLYTGRSQNKNTFGGGTDDWNREHVWAKSHGGFGNNPPCGTDAHHIRPTDVSVNGSRGNKDFDNGGTQHPEATGCYYTEYTWEPRDEVKGDVARMIFYMEVRYEGTAGEPDLEVVDWVNTSPDPEHGKFSTLYEWHQQDPPDAFEINRNNVIYSYQNNRNPFIDHPEFLINIYDPTNAVNDIYYNKLNVYPNPASEFITIESPENKISNTRITIFNSTGQVVLEQYVNSSVKINISEWQDGLYILSFIQGDKNIVRKFQIKK